MRATRQAAFVLIPPPHRLGPPEMKLPASCLNEGFVIKGYFTTDASFSSVSVYLSTESSLLTSSAHHRRDVTHLSRGIQSLSLSVSGILDLLHKGKKDLPLLSVQPHEFPLLKLHELPERAT